MTVPFRKIDNGAYVVLDTFYTLRCVGYDSRVANQSLLNCGYEDADDVIEEEELSLTAPERG